MRNKRLLVQFGEIADPVWADELIPIQKLQEECELLDISRMRCRS